MRFLRTVLPMTTHPEPDKLRGLLDGTLPPDEQARLSSHLEACETCQRAIESLVAGKESWSGAAQQLGQAAAGREAALERVMERAKDSPAAPETLREPARDEQPVRDSLQPTDQPGYIGRL